MISDEIGEYKDKANTAVVNDAKKTVDDLKTLLDGRKREEIDVDKKRAQFIKGTQLATPDGGVPVIPASPTNANGAAQAKTATMKLGRPIEIIHFGRVHLDVARAFHAKEPTDDMKELEPAALPGRAVYYRAALEREAVLLASLAKSVESALAAKEKSEGNLGKLMKGAADLVGAAGGTADSAASADMKPFLSKIGATWEKLNKADIVYADLRGAGIALHSIRTNLRAYLLEQLGKGDKAPPPAPGLLSNLPFIGELPLPGKLGEVVSTFRKVGGKLHDVNKAMIFGLTVAMQPAIEDACHDVSIQQLMARRSPIYPAWFPTKDNPADTPKEPPLADWKSGDVLQDDLKKIKPLDDINTELHRKEREASSAVNDAAKTPMEVIDFLSKKAKPAPGHAFLDHAFQAATGDKHALGGSEKLGEVAVAAFYGAIGGDSVPSFMQGFVEDFVGYVFAVCVEFLRSTYRVLCSLTPSEVVSTDQMAAAGSTHILTHLVDFATSKLGVDDFLKELHYPIPTEKLPRLPGVTWPKRDLSVAPIADELKKLLLDKASPFLKPVVGFAMSGLAGRLNAQRTWAAGGGMTMEAHLGQLPTELALLFRDLFKPLWDFLNDTLMSLISEYVGKALGPAGSALGLGSDTLGMASGFIEDAQTKATELQSHVKKIEDKAKDFIKKLSSVKVGPGQTDDLDNIEKAANALGDAAGADPFSGKKKRDEEPVEDPMKNPLGAGFPRNRLREGRGVEIADGESTTEQWDLAVLDAGGAATAPAGGAA